MKTGLRRCLIFPRAFLVFLFSVTNLWSQAEQVHEGRALVKLRVDPVKTVQVFVIPEFRMASVGLKAGLLEVGAGYRPFSALELRGAYRAGLVERDSGEQWRHRLRADLLGRAGLGDWGGQLRLRYQSTRAKERTARNVFRLRGRVSYRPIKRSAVHVSAESFFLLSDGLRKMRYGLGLSHTLKKNRRRRRIEERRPAASESLAEREEGSVSGKRAKRRRIRHTFFVDYRLDYYLSEPLNEHIYRLGYAVRF